MRFSRTVRRGRYVEGFQRYPHRATREQISSFHLEFIEFSWMVKGRVMDSKVHHHVSVPILPLLSGTT